MAYTTIQVQGLVTLPTDEPAAHHRLKFELKKADKDSALVVPHQLYYTIPSDGNIDVPLWPNARGIAGTVYYVYLIPPRTPDPSQPMGTLTVPDVAGPVNIWDHFDVGPPPTLSDAEAAELAAQSYAGLAQSWAEAGEDVEVEAGKYSALHHAAKAADSAQDAAGSAATIKIFATISALASADNLIHGATYRVNSGYNGEPGTFTYNAGSTLAADGALVVDPVGMLSVGRLISKQTHTTNLSTLLADPRSFTSYTYRTTGEGYRYVVVPSADGPGSLQTAGGDWLRYVGNQGRYYLRALNPAANGVTDDKDKIDLLNAAGYFVDLGNKDYEYGGVFTAAATFTNGRIIDNNRTYDYRPRTGETASTVGQGRGRINYQSPDAIRVYGLADEIVLGGLRYWGQYLKGRGPVKKVNNGKYSHVTVSAASNQGALNSGEVDQWYAVFAVANDEDEHVSFVLMPYLRCYSRSGKVVTLATTKQGTNGSPATVTLDIDVDKLAGVDCLVITRGGTMVGQMTTITANTTTTVTLEDAGDSPGEINLQQLDTLLPTPPGYDYYHYLGTAYWETSVSNPGDWRNIADGVHLVQSYMGNNNLVPSTGAMTNQKILYGCDISPLATGVHFSFMCTYSGGNKGSMGHNIDHDGSNHVVWRCYRTRDSLDNTILDGMGTVTFSGQQALWHSSGGSSASSAITARTVVTYGWIEP